MAARVIKTSPRSIVGTFGRCVISIWRGEPAKDMAVTLGEVLIETAERHPAGIAYLDVIEAGAPTPSAEVRRIGVENVRRLGDRLIGMATVIEGNELHTALVRAVLTGMILLMPRMQPVKICRNPNEAAAWLRNKLAPSDALLEEQLLSALSGLRGQIG